MRNELLELYLIYQAKLVDAGDTLRWQMLFRTTMKTLISAQPLMSLTKRGRLAIVMCTVGSRKVDLFAPTVLAVLACDWAEEWESIVFLQDAVRQSSLSRLRSEYGPAQPPPSHWSRKKIATSLEDGVTSAIVQSWRSLGIGGVARKRVEKIGRELRGLAAQCRGSSSRLKARELLLNYLRSHRIETFVGALIAWGQERLRASKPTVFEEAFSFLEAGQVEASRAQAANQRGAGGHDECAYQSANCEKAEIKDRQHIGDDRPMATKGSAAPRRSTPLRHSPDERDSGAYAGQDGSEEQDGFGQEEEACVEAVDGEVAEEEVMRRSVGVLRVDHEVFLQKETSGNASLSWQRGGVDAVRGDGTYDILYDDGQMDRMVRRRDIFVSGDGHVPREAIEWLRERLHGWDQDSRRQREEEGAQHPHQRKRFKTAIQQGGGSSCSDLPGVWPAPTTRTPVDRSASSTASCSTNTGRGVGSDGDNDPCGDASPRSSPATMTNTQNRKRGGSGTSDEQRRNRRRKSVGDDTLDFSDVVSDLAPFYGMSPSPNLSTSERQLGDANLPRPSQGPDVSGRECMANEGHQESMSGHSNVEHTLSGMDIIADSETVEDKGESGVCSDDECNRQKEESFRENDLRSTGEGNTTHGAVLDHHRDGMAAGSEVGDGNIGYEKEGVPQAGLATENASKRSEMRNAQGKEVEWGRDGYTADDPEAMQGQKGIGEEVADEVRAWKGLIPAADYTFEGEERCRQEGGWLADAGQKAGKSEKTKQQQPVGEEGKQCHDETNVVDSTSNIVTARDSIADAPRAGVTTRMQASARLDNERRQNLTEKHSTAAESAVLRSKGREKNEMNRLKEDGNTSPDDSVKDGNLREMGDGGRDERRGNESFSDILPRKRDEEEGEQTNLDDGSGGNQDIMQENDGAKDEEQDEQKQAGDARQEGGHLAGMRKSQGDHFALGGILTELIGRKGRRSRQRTATGKQLTLNGVGELRAGKVSGKECMKHDRNEGQGRRQRLEGSSSPMNRQANLRSNPETVRESLNGHDALDTDETRTSSENASRDASEDIDKVGRFGSHTTPDRQTSAARWRTATMSSGKFAGDTAPGAGDSGQDETSQEGDDQCFAADALVKQKADTQSPSRPPNFVRVYGSAGISRVKRSLRGWFA